MEFGLSEEQVSMQQLARDFAQKEIRPVAPEYDESCEFPWPVVKKAHEIGLTNYYFPTEYGGGGVTDMIANFIVAEELCWGCAGIATSIVGTGLAAAGIMAMGTDEQKAQWIGKFCDPNEVRLGAMCLTEPGAGSDVAGLKTTARRDGDNWVLNGQKCFITNGGIADVHLVFATHDSSLGWGGIGGYIVPKGTPGLSQGKVEHKLGVRASHTAEVILDDVVIPADYRLGGDPDTEAGRLGALGALTMLDHSRPGVGASALGIARAAFEFARDYSKERVQFGKPIAMQQAIAFKLADMATEIDAVRLLVHRAGWMINNGIPFLRGEGSMAKVKAGDVAMWAAVEAVQILGGYGYMKEYPVEKFMRDAKIYQIWEGTAEIQRIVISRAVIGRIARK
ncbi:MAG: acyl-CoA dehydrogenase family protein [Actinomycetota bacterium]